MGAEDQEAKLSVQAWRSLRKLGKQREMEELSIRMNENGIELPDATTEEVVEYTMPYLIAKGYVTKGIEPVSSKKKKGHTSYQQVKSVSKTDVDGNTISLRLQLRDNAAYQNSYHVMSWRTTFIDRGNRDRNRRFYRMGGIFWSMDMAMALHLMRKMDELEGLIGKYDDPRRSAENENYIISSEMDSSDAKIYLNQITADGEDWGEDFFFVIDEEPGDTEGGGHWRKIMLADLDRRVVTFRSTTTSYSYRPAIDMGKQELEWKLDGAMMDCSVQALRVFLYELGKFSK